MSLVQRLFGARHRSLPFLLFCVTLFSAPAPGAETSADTEQIAAPGQEELLGTMLGIGATLPGDCHFAGGGADGAIVTAEYACRDGNLVLELRHPDAAPRAALRTAHFGVSVHSGSAPQGLLDAVAALIRSREADFQWKPLHLPNVPPPPFGLIAVTCGMALLGLVVQYLMNRRFLAAQRPVRQEHLATRDKASIGRRDPRVLLTVGLVAGYLATRLISLTLLPVFIDESIHIAWAQGPFGRHFAAEYSVGKWLPIQIMSTHLLLPFGPLFGARLASVSMGLATLVACVFINRELFSLTEGLLAGLTWALLPFALLYDRLALADIYLTAFGAWALFLSIAMIERRGLIYPLAMGLCTYAAILSKPTGGLVLVIPLLANVLLVGAGDRTLYLRRSLPTLISGTGFLILLLFGGYGTGLVTSQSDFEGAAGLKHFLLNLETSRQWFTNLLTPGVAGAAVVAIIGGLAATFRKSKREVFLVAVLLVSSIPYILLSTVWYPNYLLFAVVPIALLLSRMTTACVSALSRVAGRIDPRLRLPTRMCLFAIVILLFVGAVARRDLALMTDPKDADLPWAEDYRLIRGPAAGYGLPELVAFLREQTQQGPINVVRFNSVGPAHQGLDVYLTPTEAMQVLTIDHLDPNAAARVADLANARRTLLVSNPEGEHSAGIPAPSDLAPAARIWSYVRPGSQSRMEVWEVAHRSVADR